MRHARVKAVNLKFGDVINGQRIRTTPFVHKSKSGDTVHFFLSNHGRVEPAKLLATQEVSVKRPIYNLTRKPKRKATEVVAQLIQQPPQTAIDEAVRRAEVAAGLTC